MTDRPDPREVDPLFEEDITEEADGTFSVRLDVWREEPLRGIPTREMARSILRFAHEAMETYANAAMSD